MNHEKITFSTDLAFLALFDPEVLASRIREPSDWWQDCPFLEVPEVKSGRVAILPLGVDGDYSLRLSSKATEVEAKYTRQSLTGLAVEIISERIFMGPAERLPGDGRALAASIPGQGGFFEVPNGRYQVVITALDWRFDDQWFAADGSAKPEAPPDFLVELIPSPENEDWQLPDAVPTLLSLRNRPKVEVAAPSATTLATTVRKQPTRRRGRRSAPAASVVEKIEDPKITAYRAVFEDSQTLFERFQAHPNLESTHSISAQPSNTQLKGQTWEIADLLKKFTRVRENLRVLEYKINSSKSLSTWDKIELDTLITEVYQSLVEVSLLESSQERSDLG